MLACLLLCLVLGLSVAAGGGGAGENLEAPAGVPPDRRQ